MIRQFLSLFSRAARWWACLLGIVVPVPLSPVRSLTLGVQNSRDEIKDPWWGRGWLEGDTGGNGGCICNSVIALMLSSTRKNCFREYSGPFFLSL